MQCVKELSTFKRKQHWMRYPTLGRVGKSDFYDDIGQKWKMPVIWMSWWSPGLQRKLGMRKYQGLRRVLKSSCPGKGIHVYGNLNHRPLPSSCAIVFIYSCTKKSFKTKDKVSMWWPYPHGSRVIFFFFFSYNALKTLSNRVVLPSRMIWSLLEALHFCTGLNTNSPKWSGIIRYTVTFCDPNFPQSA